MSVIFRCQKHKKYSAINPPNEKCETCKLIYEFRKKGCNALLLDLFIGGDGGKPMRKRRRHTLQERLNLSIKMKERLNVKSNS